MQFKTVRWIALATALAGYGIVAAASTVPQFISGICIIVGSVAWFVFVALRQQNTRSQATPPQAKSQLPAPWSILLVGFVLMLLGLFVFFPTAERLAIEQYQIAEGQGYQFEDLDGTDGVGLAMVMLYALISLPSALMVGLMGIGCSKTFKKAGIGRYSLATALMLSPLCAGAYTVFHYWFINWSISNGG
ncbi:MAG: hypothetical protein AAGD25_22560 [Cyanobacteria bacterium P01_F01_bin.150]